MLATAFSFPVQENEKLFWNGCIAEHIFVLRNLPSVMLLVPLIQERTRGRELPTSFSTVLFSLKRHFLRTLFKENIPAATKRIPALRMMLFLLL